MFSNYYSKLSTCILLDGTISQISISISFCTIHHWIQKAPAIILWCAYITFSLHGYHESSWIFCSLQIATSRWWLCMWLGRFPLFEVQPLYMRLARQSLPFQCLPLHPLVSSASLSLLMLWSSPSLGKVPSHTSYLLTWTMQMSMMPSTYHLLLTETFYLSCPLWHSQFQMLVGIQWMAWTRRIAVTLGYSYQNYEYHSYGCSYQNYEYP